MNHLLDKTIFLIRFILTLVIQVAVAAFVGYPNTLLVVAVFMGGALGVAAIWSIDLSLHFRNGAARRQPRDDAELIRLIRLVRALDADATNATSRPPDAPHKRKHQVLDDVLRDLSDEQLESLRQRLRDGTIDDAMLQQRMVGADGEIVYKETR